MENLHLCSVGNIFGNIFLYTQVYKETQSPLPLTSLPLWHELQKAPVLIRWKGYYCIVNNQFPLRVWSGLMSESSAATSVACGKAYSRQPIEGNIVSSLVEGACYLSTLGFRQHRSVVCQSRSKRLTLEPKADPKKYSDCWVNFSSNN